MTFPDFIRQDTDGYVRLTGHRIGLQDLVFFYNEGFSPEMLLGQFPTLSLPLIHRAIAFYLDNKAEVDAYIARCEAEVEQQRAAAKKGPDLAQLRRRMQAMGRAEGT